MAVQNLPRFVYIDNATNQNLHLVRFNDVQGRSFTDTIIATDASYLDAPSLVMGSDGYERVVFSSQGDTAIHLVICKPTGNTEVVIESGISTFYSAIALAPDNKIHIAYYEYGTSKLKYARCNADGTNVQLSVLQSFTSGSSSISCALTSDGFFRVAYFDTVPNPAVYLIVCTSADGTSNTKNRVSDTNAFITSEDSIEMYLESDDTARIACFCLTSGNSAPQGITYIRVTQKDGSAYQNTVLDGQNHSQHGMCSLSKDPNGFSRISYMIIDDALYPSSTYDVGYIKFSADDLVSYQKTVVSNPTGVNGVPISMAVGNDGFVRFIYGDTTFSTTVYFASEGSSGFTVKPITLSNAWNLNYLGSQKFFAVAQLSTNLFLQNTLMVGSETGDVQTINVGKDDNGSPINYELETQGIEFGNVFHKKQIADKLVVFAKDGIDGSIQAKVDDGDYEDVQVELDKRVNIGQKINVEGNTMRFKWSGTSNESSPILEGFYIEKVTDLGVTKG